MNEITIEIKDLNIVSDELLDIDDNSLSSLSGSGPVTALISGVSTVVGIGLHGLYKGHSTESIWEQQIIFGGVAVAAGLLTPGP